MDSLHLAVLALVQGITEFLPISSSAHLILVPQLFGWADQGLVFDVAVHAGSLVAVLVYFRKEVSAMFVAWLASMRHGQQTPDSKLAWWVMLATLPAVAAGFLFEDEIQSSLRAPWVIALASIMFGLLLWFSDHIGNRQRSEYDIGWKQALIIGCWQMLALIPGTSRSGITITAGLLLGMTRQAAARFSFLLSIPIIIASGSLESYHMFTTVSPISWSDLAIGAVLSAVSAGLCIHWFLKLIDRVGLVIFVIYRILLGIIILLVFGFA